MYVIAGIIVIAIAAYLIYHFRNWREEQTVNHFFAAVEQKNYDKAYGIWNADASWKQHPQKYSGYNFGTFELDWGPTGEYGDIRSHRIRTTITPKNASGVLVVVMINDRKEPMALWVEKKDQSMSFKPPTLDIRIEP